MELASNTVMYRREEERRGKERRGEEERGGGDMVADIMRGEKGGERRNKVRE